MCATRESFRDVSFCPVRHSTFECASAPRLLSVLPALTRHPRSGPRPHSHVVAGEVSASLSLIMTELTLPLEAAPADTPGKNVPVDPDNNPLLWDGNPACIAGLDSAVGKYYRRTGQFEPACIVFTSKRSLRAG